MIDELYNPDALLCPDVSSFKVQGGQLANESLWLMVNVTESAFNSGALEKAGVYTADISHYFNAEEYEDQGYMNSITLSETMWSLSKENAYTLSREIA